MSLITEIKDLSKLPDVLEQYEKEIPHAFKITELKGKNLEAANKENAAWLLYYDQKRIELDTLKKYLKMKLEEIRSSLFKTFTENYPREMSDRAKDKYIDGHPKYLAIYELYLEVEELYEKYASVVNGLRQQGYSLRNITEIRTHSLEDVII